MPTIEHASLIQAVPQKVFDFYCEPDNLPKISPSFPAVKLSRAGIRIGQGLTFKISISFFIFSLVWEVLIQNFEPGKSFTDVQISGPFKIWWHVHEFKETPDGTELNDKIFYEMPFGKIGKWIEPILIRPYLKNWLHFRHLRTKQCLLR